MVRSSADCLYRAQQAMHSADLASSETQRNLLIRIAQQWVHLAEHIDDCERLCGKPGDPSS